LARREGNPIHQSKKKDLREKKQEKGKTYYRPGGEGGWHRQGKRKTLKKG